MQNEIAIVGLTKTRLFEIIGEVGREIGYRKHCYPKWIESGRLNKHIAEKQMRNITGAYEILRYIYTHGTQDIQLHLFKIPS